MPCVWCIVPPITMSFAIGMPGARPMTYNTSTMANRLENLRKELVRLGLDGFIVPRADEHLGEYVPPSAERLSWLTGFTGSAGLAVVLADTAAVFTERRYVLQLAGTTGPGAGQRLP